MIKKRGLESRVVIGLGDFNDLFKLTSHVWVEHEHNGETLILEGTSGKAYKKNKIIAKQPGRYIKYNLKGIRYITKCLSKDFKRNFLSRDMNQNP